ncbi:MAG: SymE family type I addiction module toxin [Chitinophagaceae bacterium]
MRKSSSTITKQPQVVKHRRTLSVYSKFRLNIYENKLVPEIRLCGNWLANLGFKEGDLLDVTGENGKITISILKWDN